MRFTDTELWKALGLRGQDSNIRAWRRAGLVPRFLPGESDYDYSPDELWEVYVLAYLERLGVSAEGLKGLIQIAREALAHYKKDGGLLVMTAIRQGGVFNFMHLDGEGALNDVRALMRLKKGEVFKVSELYELLRGAGCEATTDEFLDAATGA